MLFEMMIVAAFGVMLVAGFLNVARPADAVVMLGLQPAVAGVSECVAQLPAPREVLGGWYNEAKCRRSLKRFLSSISVDNTHN